MSQEDVRILVLLRAGHVGLNFYLNRVGRAESTICACGLGRENVFHFSFLCPTWREQRQHLRIAMRDRWANLSYALGGWSDRKNPTSGKLVDGRRDKWKPNIGVLKAVIQFVKSTGRLQPERGGREVEREVGEVGEVREREGDVGEVRGVEVEGDVGEGREVEGNVRQVREVEREVEREARE
jgi:hypothetical protein